MKTISMYELKKREFASYIPILDNDASFSAKFLTKEDLKRAHNLLIEAYEDLKSGKVKYAPLTDTIMDSEENFMWFATFFKVVEDSLGIQVPYHIPYTLCPSNKGWAPKVYQPFEAVMKRSKVKLKPLDTNVEDQDPINNYRILYLMEDYDIWDFQDGCYPGWYLLKDTTVFEQYNEKTNTRVKIDFRNGDFYYFTAGASDNWQPVADVPIEMNHIISALLFRNF